MPESGDREVDVLIAGGGLAGLLLAHELRKRGSSVVVADDPRSTGAWNAAVGLLNPLRGQRYTLAWRAGEAFAAAREIYESLNTAGSPAWIIRDIPIVRLFANEAERNAGVRRMTTVGGAGFPVRELERPPAGLVPAVHGGLVVSGGAVVCAPAVVEALRAPLIKNDAWISARCMYRDLEHGSGFVRWKTRRIHARRLVLAGGADDIGNPFLDQLPLAPVKGESLVIEAPALPPGFALAGEHHLAPRPDGTWSCGGTKSPGVRDVSSNSEARAELERFLVRHLECEWKTVGQRAGVRAVTTDHLPVVGVLNGWPHVFVFNGLGSQGVAYGPWLSRLLAAHMFDGASLLAETSVGRFAKRPARVSHWHAVDVAHDEAASRLAPGDLAIDLTTGNGGDTCWLAARVGPGGRVIGIDIQQAAIEATHQRLEHSGLRDRVDLQRTNHADLSAIAGEKFQGRVAVVIANLGHLPGSNSQVVTRPESTCRAFDAALPLLNNSGALVAVVYAGHREGAKERDALEEWAAALDSTQWRAEWRSAPTGDRAAPAVLIVSRPLRY